MSLSSTLAAFRAAQNSIRVATLRGECRALDDHHEGYLIVGVYLTRSGQLVMTTRYRCYSITSGHSVPTAPSQAQFTTDQAIHELMAAHGVELPDLQLKPAPPGLPRKLKKAVRKPLSSCSPHERLRVARLVYAIRAA